MIPRSPAVDASVAIKWVVEEDLSENARALVQETTRAGLLLTAPLHLPREVTNGLYQQVRRGNLALDDAEEALLRFGRIRLDLAAPLDL